MEPLDDRLETRVWQRIYSTAPPETPDLSAELSQLVLQERYDRSTYRQLASRLPDKKLQQLIRETDSAIAALEGMQCLFWETPKEVPACRTSPGLTCAALRRCSHDTCLRMAQYARHSSHSLAGPVFSALADGASRRCWLLALLAAESRT